MRPQTVVSCGLAVLVSLAPAASLAQFAAARDAPIVFGHVHLNVLNLAESMRFFAVLGGVPAKLGPLELVKFPYGLVMMTPQAPTAGSKGSTVNHLGLYIRDLRATVDRLRATGYPIVTEQEWSRDARTHEPLPAVEYRDGIGYDPVSKSAVAAFTMGPDGVKVELVAKDDLTGPADMGHIHFFTTQVEESVAWYQKVFGGSTFPGAAPRGVHFNRAGPAYEMAQSPQAGIKGRAIDHIGFEVRNLEAFTSRLANMGITLDQPYSKVRALNDLGVAFLTDPWGTYIELTEGLDKVQ